MAHGSHGRRLAHASAAIVAMALGAAQGVAGTCGIAGASPPTGGTQGGYPVTLFFAGALPSIQAVYWNGEPVSVSSSTSSSITVTAPAGQGPVTVSLAYSAGGACNGETPVFSYNAPTIAAITPPAAQPHRPVRVVGSNFGTDPEVLVGGVPAYVISHSHQSVAFSVPELAPGMHPVVVRSAGAESNAVLLQVAPPLRAQTWHFADRSTEGGDLFVLNGVGFDAVTGLTVDGAPATFISVSESQILAATPPGVGVMRVIELETALIQETVTSNFAYDGPAIDGVTVVGSDTLVITGKDFGPPGAATVSVNGQQATILSSGHRRIEAEVAGLTPGTASVVVVSGEQVALGSVEVGDVCRGDTNGDGQVSFADLNAVLEAFGRLCAGAGR